MNLRQMSTRSQTRLTDGLPIPIGQQCMELLLHGASTNVPAIDPKTYREFRSNVGRLALQIPKSGSDEDALLLTRTILHEFENYYAGAQSALRGSLDAWHGVVTTLLTALLESLGIQPSAQMGLVLKKRIRDLAAPEEIEKWREEVERLICPFLVTAQADSAEALKQMNPSKANDNAAGLMGGGSALEHVGKLMEEGVGAFIVVFELRCLNIISMRFGQEAVQDCLMAVSAFLTAGLESRDKIFHWSDSKLLAVLLGRPNEPILRAELDRIISKNRESTIRVAGRPIMVRIPLTFEILPINRLRSPEDLIRLSGLTASSVERADGRNS